jgi:hypothetical protein
MRRHRNFRRWAIGWAVLQFALPATATFADATLERDSSAGSFAHVESQSRVSCHPVHPAECALCQVLSRTAAPTAQSPSWLDIIRVVEQPAIAERSQRALAGRSRLSRARAPPLS